MCRLICNLPELSIRIFQSACFLFFLINRYEFRITETYGSYTKQIHLISGLLQIIYYLCHVNNMGRNGDTF